jgi:hypothetical protein
VEACRVEAVMMSRKQWIRYHELKHLVTRLGCTMWEPEDEAVHVEKLCEEILWLVMNIKAECIISQRVAAHEHEMLHPSAA